MVRRVIALHLGILGLQLETGTVEILDEGLLSSLRRPNSGDWQSVTRAPSEVPGPDPDDFPSVATSYDRALSQPLEDVIAGHTQSPEESQPPSEAFARGVALSKQLWSSNIPTIVSSTGDLMLDMSSFKTSEEQALKAELIARKILSEDLEGNYDIGSLIGADEKGNIWIYSSSEAKEAADRKAGLRSLNPAALRSTDALSDPGYHSDDGQSETGDDIQNSTGHLRTDSDSALGISMPGSPDAVLDNEEKPDRPIRNYAKTLRLTNEQLKSLDLKPGANAMSFTVNKATCQAVIYYWRHNVPIVISDIDGTITKSVTVKLC
jgi:phosphatidate phosphatase LPIN